MSAFADVKLELGVINEATNEIASDIDDLIALMTKPGGMTEAEAVEVVSDLRGVSEKLKGIAAKHPAPPAEPPPTPPVE